MKKLFAMVGLITLMALFAACGGGNQTDSPSLEPTSSSEVIDRDLLDDSETELVNQLESGSQRPDITLTPSGNAPNDMFVAQLVAQSRAVSDDFSFYDVPDIIFTTTGEENGLGNTFMYLRGTIQSFEELDEFDVAIVQTSGRTIGMSLPKDVFDWGVSEGLLTVPSEIDFLEVGQEFGLFILYMGYSNELDMPMGMFVGLDTSGLYIPPVIDFFSDEDRQERYRELYRSYSFQELYDFVNSYIEEYNPSERDSAFDVLELLRPIFEFEKTWIVEHDAFDNSYTVVFNEARSISPNNTLAISLQGTNLETKMGFVRNGWLFFNMIEINVDGEQLHRASYRNIVRNVLTGRTVEEFVFASFNDRFYDGLSDANVVTVRFSNTDSREQYDRVLTQSEIDALLLSRIFQRTYRDVSNLLFRFNRQ